MLTHTPVQLILAQAMVEHGLLDSIAAGLSNARYRLELYIGQGNTIYFVAAVVVLLVLTRVRRQLDRIRAARAGTFRPAVFLPARRHSSHQLPEPVEDDVDLRRPD